MKTEKAKPVVYIRPKFIGFSVVDPMDGFELFREIRTYDIHESAAGDYRRMRDDCIEMGEFAAKKLHKNGSRPALRLRRPRVHMLRFG